PDELLHRGRTRDLVLQRDELAAVHHVTAIALGEIHVIAVRYETHPRRSRIAEVTELLAPARADDRWTAGRMAELVRGVIGRLDDDHHARAPAQKAPPGHRPAFDDVALHLALVGRDDLVILHVADGTVFMWPIARQQDAADVAEHGVIHIMRIERRRPVEPANGGVVLIGGDIEDHFFIPAFE